MMNSMFNNGQGEFPCGNQQIFVESRQFIHQQVELRERKLGIGSTSVQEMPDAHRFHLSFHSSFRPSLQKQ